MSRTRPRGRWRRRSGNRVVDGLGHRTRRRRPIGSEPAGDQRAGHVGRRQPGDPARRRAGRACASDFARRSRRRSSRTTSSPSPAMNCMT